MTVSMVSALGGSFVLFLLAERFLRRLFRSGRVSAKATYYGLASLQGACLTLATAAALATTTTLVRAEPFAFLVAVPAFMGVSIGAMAFLAWAGGKMRRLDIEQFIAKKYG